MQYSDKQVQALVKSRTGFTIIEVMIVLAIAGLIIIILLLAVPALGRNARNTARKNDAAIVMSALLEYVNTNEGAFPTDCSGNPGPNCDTTFLKNQKFSFYESKNISFNYRVDGDGDANLDYDGSGNPEWITTANYYKCNGPGTATHTGASRKNIVALYEFEGSAGSSVHRCVDL